MNVERMRRRARAAAPTPRIIFIQCHEPPTLRDRIVGAWSSLLDALART